MPERHARTFRVFLSSTFADLTEERNLLHQKVFPELARICEGKGTVFEPIDLRWGISQEAALDHMTIEICLDEVSRCLDASPRPNFLILLGNRYGWRPPPRRIPQDHFERLTTRMDAASRLLMGQWYLRDENACAEDAPGAPAAYLLKPRRGRFRSPVVWNDVERALTSAIERAASGSPADNAYTASATEQEILAGALSQADAREHVFCFVRTITNLDELRRDARTNNAARTYLDLQPAGDPDPDKDAQARLDALKATLKRRLGRRMQAVPARWNGSAVVLDRPDEFRDRVLRALGGVIGRELRRLARPDARAEERRLHHAFADRIRRDFAGREDEIHHVLAYVQADEPHAFLVHGEAGTGKSAFLAHVASLTRRALPASHVFEYFVGATPSSSSLRELLSSLCRDLGGVIRNAAVASGTVNDLAFELRQRIDALPANRHVVIFLDAIERVQPEQGVDEPWWLPTALRPSVRLVASTASDRARDYVGARVPRACSMRLGPMSREAGRRLLAAWLQRDRRRLRRHQETTLLDNFERTGNPLYLRLGYEEARRWRSFDSARRTRLDATLDGLMRSFLERLSRESAHGQSLVERSLALLGSARYGLTEVEMIELLSADAEVMAEHRRRSPWSPVSDRLPFVVWSRLRADLAAQLAEREIGGTRRLSFFYPAFARVAASSYLDRPTAKARAHRALAAFFGAQPLWQAGESRSVNQRVVEELPHQELGGLRWLRAEQRLTSLDFIEAKCQAGYVSDLQRDYLSAAAEFDARGRPTENLLQYRDFCSAHQHVFAADPSVVVPFAYNVASSGAVAREAASALNQRRWRQQPWILLEQRPRLIRHCALRAVAVGHVAAITALAVDARGHVLVSGSADGTARVWDLPSGFQRFVLPTHVGFGVNAVALSADGAVGVTGGEDGMVRVWDLRDGTERAAIQVERNAVLGVAINADGSRFAAAGTEGVVRVWHTGSQTLWRELDGHFGAVSSVAMDTAGRWVCSGGLDQTVRLWNLSPPSMERCYEGHRSRVLAVAIADNGVIVSGSGFPDPAGGLGKNLNDSEIRAWRGARGTWSAQHGAWLRGGLSGVWGSAVMSVALDRAGRRAISGGYDRVVGVWDAATGDLVNALNFHTDRVRAVACDSTGRLAVSGGDDHRIAIWDVEGESHPVQGDTPARVRLGRSAQPGVPRTAAMLWRNKRLRNLLLIPGVSVAMGFAYALLGWSLGFGLPTLRSTVSAGLTCGAIIYAFFWRKEIVYDPQGWRWRRAARAAQIAGSLLALPFALFFAVLKCPMCAEPIAGRRRLFQCWRCGWRDVGLVPSWRTRT